MKDLFIKYFPLLFIYLFLLYRTHLFLLYYTLRFYPKGQTGNFIVSVFYLTFIFAPIVYYYSRFN